MANAWIAGISADHRWGPKDGQQRAEASYQLRAAVDGLDSDLVYKTALRRGALSIRSRPQHRDRVAFAGLHHRERTALRALLAGQLVDAARLGQVRHRASRRRAHVPFVGRVSLWHIAVFFDAGSVWDRNADSNVRYSTGFGVHSDNSFLTVGFPLDSDDAGATFMAGVRF